MREIAASLVVLSLAIAGFGGCSSSDSSSGSGSGGSSTGTAGSSGQGCNATECFRPYECVSECGGEVVHSGCCACAPPLIDRLYCKDDAASTDSAASTGGSACEPGIAATGRCQALASICTGTDLCCKCVDFPQAPSCGMQWSCALPKNNVPDCPSAAPALGSPCTTLKITCQYCTPDGPHFLRCAGADASGMWSEVPGLNCAE